MNPPRRSTIPERTRKLQITKCKMPDILNQAHTRKQYHTLHQCLLDEVAPPLLRRLKGRVTGTVGMTVIDITSAAGINVSSGT